MEKENREVKAFLPLSHVNPLPYLGDEARGTGNLESAIAARSVVFL